MTYQIYYKKLNENENIFNFKENDLKIYYETNNINNYIKKLKQIKNKYNNNNVSYLYHNYNNFLYIIYNENIFKIKINNNKLYFNFIYEILNNIKYDQDLDPDPDPVPSS